MSSSYDYPQRRNIALPGHDYKGPNSYFVTIRAYRGENIFGKVVNGEVQLSFMGEVVEEEWLRTPLVRPYVSLDAFVVMPNHFHGIIDIHMKEEPFPAQTSGSGAFACSLGAILGQFKSVASKRCRALGHDSSHPLWLRRWYDRVIRSESEKASIRSYIWDNPVRWEQKRAGL